MGISLKPELQKLIEERVRAGQYQSADAFVNEAVEQFISQDEFAAGEMERLLAAGEADADAGRLVDADEVFRRIQARSDDRRQSR